MTEQGRFPRAALNDSIPRRFQQIVDELGTSTAVVCASGSLTYDDLEIASSTIAHQLVQRLGQGQEPIALLLQARDLAIAALLGVLKAGKFFVPLEPSYPTERLAFIVDDCEPRMIIADRGNLQLGQTLASKGTVVADIADLQWGTTEDHAAQDVSSDATAAVFYTSGSTGGPKGVMQSHRAILHRAMSSTNLLEMTPSDRVSLLASPSYSMSLRPIFATLLNGATLCPFDIVHEGIANLPVWLQRNRITMYSSVPSVFRQIAPLLTDRHQLETLRIAELGGERATARDFELFKRSFPANCLFVNTLGSNETGIVRMYKADKAQRLEGDVVPVGYAVEDKHLSIVDANGEELEAGRIGEIVVRSEFLASGYWKRPALTSTTFTIDDDNPSRRVFRMGDLGVLSADGCLTVCGRKDFRIKVRGIRIEPEEIESSLQSHPDVDRAAVVAREDVTGEPRPVAYIAPRPGRVIAGNALRSFVAARLPAHMVPAAFVVVETFPHTPNGKLDRAALPPPSVTNRLGDERLVGARTPMERSLTAICEDLLGTRDVGVHDSLFDLGADSLMLIRLSARIEQEFGRRFPPAAVFVAPTIAELAEALNTKAPTDRWPSLYPVQTMGSRSPFFWIHGDTSTALLASYLGSDQPLYGLEHQSQDGYPALYTEVATIAGHYLRQIREVQPQGPYLLGGYSFGGLIAYEIAQQLQRVGEQTLLLALLDPPSLASGEARRQLTRSAGRPVASKSVTITMSRHIREISRLPFAKRTAYIWPRAIRFSRTAVGVPALTDTLKRLVYKAHLRLGRPLPAFVRSRYVLDLYTRARERYAPQPYTGRTLLFKGALRRYAAVGDWEQLLTGDLDVRVVDGTHTELRDEWCVKTWAAPLKAALDDCYVSAA